MFKRLSYRQKLLFGAVSFLIGAALLFLIAKVLGLLIADILDADISEQIYRIVVMAGFGAVASVYFVTFRRVRRHIQNFSARNAGGAFGMQRMHVIQGAFVVLFIVWVVYTIWDNVKEIMAAI